MNDEDLQNAGDCGLFDEPGPRQETPKDILNRLEASSYCHNDGIHFFEECPACGFLTWCRTEQSLAPEGRIQPHDPYSSVSALCRRCSEIAYRFPDVFGWVTKVVRWHEYKSFRRDKP